jgi:transposase
MPAAKPPEFRRRAVELARQREKPIAQIARDLEIAETCLRRWMKQDDVDAGRIEGVSTDERAELVRLRRELRVAQMEIEILKRARADSTGQRNSAAASLSAGVSKFRVLRGREFSFAAITSRSSCVR